MSGLTAVSLFAGVGGFDEALQRAGVRVAASVEIDPACRGVLRRHFPESKIFNDVTEVTGDQLRAAGLVPGNGIVTAGWPCQGNSVAGRGKGMADPRSGLWRHVVRVLAEARPRWFIGENVPGLLSVNGGRDFGTVIRDLDDLGYGVAWRVLDAQWFGVPQRRRRVFLAGCLGDPRGPVEVLLEPESGGWNPPPGRQARPGAALATGRRARSTDGRVTAATLQGGGQRGHRVDAEGAAGGHLVPVRPGGIAGTLRTHPRPGSADPGTVTVAHTVTAREAEGPDSDATSGIIVTHALTAEGADASEDGTGRGTPLVPVFAPLTAGTAASPGVNAAGRRLEDDWNLAAAQPTAVRRLTPRECERLQGLPAVEKTLRIEVCRCTDHPKILALAGSQNPRSQRSAPDADAPGSRNPAQPAGSHSPWSRPDPALPVVASVHIDCEANEAEIRSPDGRRWSVNGAAPKSSLPLAALLAVSARLFAPTPRTPEPAISGGKAASPPSPAPSTPQPSGAICVPACGLETDGTVCAAHKSGLGEASHSTSITSQAGRATQNSGLTWTTLCCSALRAIGAFIPLPTPEATSYAVELTASAGWTRWLDDGTEQSDSARYRQCGNSLALPVVEWIARRTVAVDAASAAYSPRSAEGAA